MCNAYNHSFDCDCGFGGDTGGGWRRRGDHVVILEPVSAGWAKDSRGTVESYINPNAHCPVCGAPVYFYRSPYDGRVFFDELGWPWPKHPCTDNYRQPRRATRASMAGRVRSADPAWQAEGWHPLLSSRVHSAGGRLLITGDLQDEFLELCLAEGEQVDPNSPVFVRAQPGKPDLFEATFLRSDHFDTRVRTTAAFRTRIAPLGNETILKAAHGDAAANHIVGQFVLWQLDDPAGARPYLQDAVLGGNRDALIDFAVVLVFRAGK